LKLQEEYLLSHPRLQSLAKCIFMIPDRLLQKTKKHYQIARNPSCFLN
jgi:hypothetical protein